MTKRKTYRQLESELMMAQSRLEDLEETLRAITNNEVDALVVDGPDGHQVFTLQGPDQPYRTLMETMSEGALTIAAGGTILYCNKHFSELVGMPLNKIIGISFHDLIVSQEGRSLEEMLKECRAEGCKTEFSLKTSAGGEVPVSLSANLLGLNNVETFCIVTANLTEQKRIQAMLEKNRDLLEDRVEERTADLKAEIAERKRIEEALRESETRLRATLRSTADEIWITDAQGRIVSISNSVSENLGISSDRFADIKAALDQLEVLRLDGTPRPREEAILIRALHGEVIKNEGEIIRNLATGQLRWREVFSAPVRDAEGRIAGAVAVIRDITERKRMEEALQRRNAIETGINKILNVALTSSTEGDLGRACLEVAEEITQSKFGFIGRVNEDGLEDVATSNPGWDYCQITDPKGHRALKIHGIYGRVIFDGMPLITNDPAHHRDSAGIPEGHPPLESFLGVPMIREGNVVGIIAVGNREGGYSHDDQESLESLGPVIVEAFLRKQAEDAVKKSNDRTAILASISSALLQSTNPQELVEELCGKVMDHLKCDAFFNFLIDEDAGRLHLNACAGIPESIARQIEWLDFGVAVCGTAARDACRIIAENIRENPDPKTDLVSSFGIQAYACHPLFGEEGRVLGTLSFASRYRTYFSEDDISFMKAVADHVAIAIQRKRSRDELENRVHQRTMELRRLATAVENAAEAIIITDTSWYIEYVNPAFARMTGYAYDDVHNKDLSILRSPDIRDTVYEKARQAAIQNIPVLSRVPVRKKNGSILTVDSFLTPAKDEFGNTSNFVAVWRDVTEHIKLEEQLRQSQKMEAIGTLAGGIAHDFNNILAAILGFTEMAIDDVSDGRSVDKSLRNVLKSTFRARDLVSKILTFSRKTSYDRAPISLSPLVKETVQLLRASIPATIEIKLSIAARSDTVLAAPTEVQQILMNLATNASLAMEETGGTLEIILSDVDFMPHLSEVVTDLMPEEYVQIMVRDTGTGMSPDVMRRMFEPFFTTRELGAGTGMGLAMVYGIVRDLEGTITVESEPGIGSAFRVFLPKIKVKTKKPRTQKTHILKGTESILFVDDEDMLVDWAKASFERLGYSVIVSTDPTEALQIFASDPSRIDLVITDQAMPGMSGMQLAGELLEIRPDIPIILCTGHSATVSPETAKKAGIKEFLMKPVARQDLARVIRDVLGETPE